MPQSGLRGDRRRRTRGRELGGDGLTSGLVQVVDREQDRPPDVGAATFITQIAVQPGERYYASIWAKSSGSSQQTPLLEIKWQAPESGWVNTDANQAASGEGGTGEWQLLSAIVEVPADAGRLIILPRAKEQEKGDVVLLDDARIIRLPDELLGEE